MDRKFIDRVVDVPVMAQRQGPSGKKELEEVPADMMTSGQGPVAQIMQKTWENPQEQSISEVIHVSEVKQRRVSTGIKTDRTVEVPRVIPQERILKPAGERASVRERVRQFERNGGASCSYNVEVPRAAPGDRQSEEAEDEAPSKRRKQESDIEPQIPVHFSLCDGSSEQEAKSVDDSAELETRVRGECEGVPVARLDDILSEMRDVKTELLQVRELVGVLIRRERSAETKAEIAARRLDRMEREQTEADDAEQEANLQEALVNQSKAVKVVVDKWFVDKGHGFGKAPTGEVVFIHASTVQGAEVLMIGTDAWVQVVNDDARAQGVYRAKRAWGRDEWKAERDKEQANKVAQRVRRAAALTAELAAQSEKKTPAVCDQPPGLDELAGHIEAPNMGAGGSPPQATMMPDPWATYERPSANEGQATTGVPPETNKGTFALTKGFREARSRSATRNMETRSMVDEAVDFYEKATGRDRIQKREELVNMRPGELRRSLERWQAHAKEVQRLQEKKEHAWDLYSRVASFGRKKKEDFEKDFGHKVVYSGKVDEKRLREWTDEMQSKVQKAERELETRERKWMASEDSNSQRRRTWEKLQELADFSSSLNFSSLQQ